MGYSSSSNLSLGVSLTIKDLMTSLTPENFRDLHPLLEEGFIDDENGQYTSVYREILSGVHPWKKTEVDLHTLEFKAYKTFLSECFASCGDCDYKQEPIEYSGNMQGNLYAQTVLLPTHSLCGLERWGYNRVGENAIGQSVDLDELFGMVQTIKERMKNLDSFTVSFIVSQEGS